MTDQEYWAEVGDDRWFKGRKDRTDKIEVRYFPSGPHPDIARWAKVSITLVAGAIEDVDEEAYETVWNVDQPNDVTNDVVEATITAIKHFEANKADGVDPEHVSVDELEFMHVQGVRHYKEWEDDEE